MIIITNRAQEVVEWIGANCVRPSRYEMHTSWSADRLEYGSLPRRPPEQVSINLTPTDQLLFDIYFAGWFIENPDKGRWYDNTPINRAILSMRANGPSFE
jgi:hypothetical protein